MDGFLMMVLDFPCHPNHVFCIGRGNQDVAYPSLLPHLWGHKMVPMALGSYVGYRGNLFHRLPSGCGI